jgi:hypothetical protein
MNTAFACHTTTGILHIVGAPSILVIHPKYTPLMSTNAFRKLQCSGSQKSFCSFCGGSLRE